MLPLCFLAIRSLNSLLQPLTLRSFRSAARPPLRPGVAPLLGRRVFVTATVLKNKSVVRAQSFAGDDVVLDFCTFSGLSARPGSPIVSAAPLRITGCRFFRCSGESGGAARCNRTLWVGDSTVQNCTAHVSGAFDFRTQRRDNFDVSECAVAETTADYFGCLYRLTRGSSVVRATNISRARARSCVGCLEANGGYADFAHVVFSDTSAGAHNGCVCARDLQAMVFDRCVFARCRHGSSENDVARALLAYDNPYDSVLAASLFVDSGRPATWAITVFTGDDLLITGCSFSGSKEAEICPNNIALDNCRFDVNHFPPIEVGTEPVVGQRQVGRKGGGSRSVILPAACGIAAVTVCGITWLQVELRKLCPEAGKPQGHSVR
jgi:hypothetical protein